MLIKERRFTNRRFIWSAGCKTAAPWSSARGTLDHPAMTRQLRLLIPAHRRNFHDVFRIEIDQLEPIFSHIGRRKNIVLRELGDERKLQIAFADSGGRLR